MTSRFFQGSDSSESESDEQELYNGEESEEESDKSHDSEESSEEESDENAEGSSEGSSSEDEGVTGASRFLKAGGGAASSDEESDEERPTQLRSAKDKRIEEAEAVVKLIENAIKINDWHTISSEFDKLTKMKDGLVKMADGRMPKLYSESCRRPVTRLYFG
jgi:translation initiation factor 3 subunit C